MSKLPSYEEQLVDRLPNDGGNPILRSKGLSKWLVVLILSLGLGWVNPQDPAAASGSISSCTNTANQTRTCRYSIDVDLSGGATATATGWLSFPTDTATSVLLVYGHGCCRAFHAGSADPDVGQKDIVTAIARDHRAAAISMDYRGNGYWNVKAGAEDLIAATEDLQSNLGSFTGLTHTLTRTILWGASMGGETTGLALAARPDLYDFWVDTFGVTDLAQEWAVLAASQDPNYNLPGKIEVETGGKPHEVPQEYISRSPVFKASDMARPTVTVSDGSIRTSKLKRVYFSHGVGDFVVPYSQSREMASALTAHGVPVSFHTVVSGECPSGCIHVWNQRAIEIPGVGGPGGHDPYCKRAMYPSCWDVLTPLLTGTSVPDAACPVAEWQWHFAPGSNYGQAGSGTKVGACLPPDPPLAPTLTGLYRTSSTPNDRLVASTSPITGTRMGSCRPSTPDPDLTELWEASIGWWFYTTHAWEPHTTIVCYVHLSPGPSRVPIHRLYDLTSNHHFYTTCESELVARISSSGIWPSGTLRYEGTEGFLSSDGRDCP